MSGEGIVLHACALASKYGFWDGDILSEIIFDKLGYEQWTNARQSEILVDLVRERLLPLLPGVEVYEIITCHNPIRAKDEWASFCRDSSVSVEIPVEDILRRVAPKAAQNAQNERAVAHQQLCDDEGCDHHGTPHVCVNPKSPVKRGHAVTAE